MSHASLFHALRDARDEATFGGKATQLAAAIAAELPVPPGFALAHAAALEVLESGGRITADLRHVLACLGGSVAVRSSAVGEDSATASFAGQHATVLNVETEAGLLDAIRVVVDSARAESALAYRRKLGLSEHPAMGVVVQHLVHAEVAGVLFTRHPVTGADERVIEAAWGLGEAVVAGLVTPDNVRVARGGRVIAYAIGDKDRAVRWVTGGGTEEVEVEPNRAGEACLRAPMLGAIERLAARCEAVFGGAQDLEFAFEAGALYLLQRRAITRGAT